uniref:Putative ribonuclease H-like domain-containing protein n=1 Tax=Tanacetum cinerariifolium TaxID=118510 RepID=A0A699H8P9_TANCI|nr:putative ribonuclease H-like domain-containing protein [Tanacetum cinerariifolium]
MLKSFSLLAMKIPLLEYFATASEEVFPLLLLKKFALLYLQNEHYALWEVIEFDDSYKATPEESSTGSTSESSAKKKGRTVAITTKDMQKRRNDVKIFGGNEATKKTKKNQLKHQYGNFKAEANTSSGKGEVNTTSIPTTNTQVFLACVNVAAASISHDTIFAYIASQSNGSQIKYEDIYQIDEYDIKEMDIKWNMSLLSMRDDRFLKKTGKKITIQGTDMAGFDKSKVKCFNCHKMGHFAKECRAPRSQDRGWDWSYMANEEENHALVVDDKAPIEFALMAKSSSTSENETRGLEFDVKVKNNKIENLMNELEKVKKEKDGLDSKLIGFESVSKDLDTLLESQRSDKNKEGVLDKVLFSPPAQVYSPPKKNMSWTRLLEFVDDTITDYIRPSLSIESNSNNLQNSNSSVSEHEESSSTILSKPMIKFFKAADSPIDIKTNKVETVRKSSVRYAKMTPRQHNMYSIDLNKIVPHKDLTCLVAKASANESMVWHRRLGHLNFKTMNKLVRHNLVKGLPSKCFENNHTYVACLKGKQHKASCKTNGILRNFITEIENLKDLKVKIIKCDNGGEFKNKEMYDFCIRKGIKREFSNARTPQQNKAKAVNTACYVQNRVLVNKSHNKTPYELFNSRTPDIEILKPFGCHVMNLNTLDHLEKFDAKGDEDFLENKLIEKGAGPNWLFEIDTLTNFMNYVPVVVAGTSSTNFSESTIPTVSSPVLTTCLDDSLETSSATRLISKRVTSQDKTPSQDNISTLSNRFEDILRVSTNPVDINGVEADLSNMESIVPASPTPTFRIHKDHPKSQIIGPVDTSMDVKSAFLYGTIEEEVYVMQPPRFQDPQFPHRVYKVEKAMYGLHQAPRAWYGTLSKYLLAHGFQRGTIDQTLFIRKHKGDFLLVQVYVDDIIFGSSNPQLYREFEALMHDKFQMSAMGELNFFLVLQVLQKKDGIFLSQDKYVGDILKKFGYSDVRSADTPMDKENPWGKDGPGKDVDLHLYRSMIGSLMYITASRPDIIFAICACARHQVTPKECHLHAFKRIFRYLKVHPKLRLWYPKESPFDLVAYSDSDYGGANQDRKSTAGGCQFLERRLISWQCKKLTIVANSTTEAEYVAAASGCGQVLWIQNQLLDYGYNFMNTKIYIDNNNAIYIVKNPVYHSKTKHIEIKHHFIRDCYEKKLINVDHIHIDNNVADLLTKPFDVGRF